MLAANAIHALLKECTPVLYFFFREIVDANHSPRAALGDWLTQALICSPPLQLQLKTYIATPQTSGEQQATTEARELDSILSGDLWQHLWEALSHLK